MALTEVSGDTLVTHAWNVAGDKAVNGSESGDLFASATISASYVSAVDKDLYKNAAAVTIRINPAGNVVLIDVAGDLGEEAFDGDSSDQYIDVEISTDGNGDLQVSVSKLWYRVKSNNPAGLEAEQATLTKDAQSSSKKAGSVAREGSAGNYTYWVYVAGTTNDWVAAVLHTTDGFTFE